MATSQGARGSRKGCPNYPIEFKRGLAAQACSPGISVAKLALAHGINANLLFKWRRQYRADQPGVCDGVVEGAPQPVLRPAVPLLPVVETMVAPVEPSAAKESCIEVIFRCATVRICGQVDRAQLEAVLGCLVRRT